MPVPLPGDTLSNSMLGTVANDELSWNKWFEYRRETYEIGNMGNYWQFLLDPNYLPDGYACPPDVQGRGAVALDFAGRPVYLSMGHDGAQTNDPYELDLSKEKGRGLSSTDRGDNPFSVAELERMVRPFDADVSRLPDRVERLFNSVGTVDTASRRHEIATESWDLPCPNVAMTPTLTDELKARNGDRRAHHLIDLLRTKVADADMPDRLKELFSLDMRAGLRFDVNRPFGNGRDDDGNDVVDEYWWSRSRPLSEQETMRLFDRPGNLWPPGPIRKSFWFSPDDDPTPPSPSPVTAFEARIRYARHLYVLMMLLIDDSYVSPDWDPAKPVNEERARWIAQWAINVVDFRDRDSIMTPFTYDPDPFSGGWNASSATMVWGCERPELLISETLAFHDRRTEDLDRDTGNSKLTTDAPPDNDEDFDQKIKPQGSLFIELFNPWTRLEPCPAELSSGYTTVSNTTGPKTVGVHNGGIDLGKKSPSGGSPVWRLVIVAGDEFDEDPDDPVLANRPTFERAVYFVDSTANLPTDIAVKFQPDDQFAGRIAPILPGRYAVIGPGEKDEAGESTTYIGFKNDGTRGNATTRRIVLRPNADPNRDPSKESQTQFDVFSSGIAPGDMAAAADVKPAVSVVINSPRRLSISEPDDGYIPYTAADGNSYDPPEDTPLDATLNLGMWSTNNGTFEKVKVVHLQRLANPMRPHHPTQNPYRTIDSAAIDLTAFNGVTSANDPSVVSNPRNIDKFRTLERGEFNQPRAMNLWAQEPLGPGRRPAPHTSAIAPPADHYFEDALSHTLGYLNYHFGPPRYDSDYDLDFPEALTYQGDPREPFPWLTWNNRPFISQLELLLVPTTSQSGLLGAYGFDVGNTPYASSDPANVPYPHLMNLFHSAKWDDTTGSSPQLHRLFEYLHVPSRFVGTEDQLDPGRFAQRGSRHWFHPPFNKISRYRDPGRMNLNTIFSHRVWTGLMNYFPGMWELESWDAMVWSRRRYGAAAPLPDPSRLPAPTDLDYQLKYNQEHERLIHTEMMTIDPNYPTRFAQPFRSYAGGALVPPGMEADREIDATVLRPHPDTISNPSKPERPLFEWEANVPNVDDYRNTERNPYFRYQGIQRLGNLTTTRSNVYAIWITVGYFEVSPWERNGRPVGVDTEHPDGYQLGQELGLDMGEVERHRAFYIIDRSIPVGFQRGQDLNVEKTILLRRFIE
ncbi:MAG: hypothetical protein V3R99_09420 [Thermoguttaceae bacterium]